MSSSGRRQTVTSAATANFIWDGQDVLLETDSGNTTQVTYTQTPNIYGDLVSQRRGAITKYYHFDALGSTLALTASDESVTDTYRYYAFGETLTSSGATTNNFRFVGNLGYYNESALALQYLRARYYQPATGRFVSVDPQHITTTLTSPYSYAANNPVNMIDPSGELCLPFWWTIKYIEGDWGLDPDVWPNPKITYPPDQIRTTWYSKRVRSWYKKTLCYEKDECGNRRSVPKYKWVHKPQTKKTTHILYRPTDPCLQTFQMYAIKLSRPADFDGVKYVGACHACCNDRYGHEGAGTLYGCYASCSCYELPVPGQPW